MGNNTLVQIILILFQTLLLIPIKFLLGTSYKLDSVFFPVRHFWEKSPKPDFKNAAFI